MRWRFWLGGAGWRQSFVKEMGFSTADSANLKALVSGGAIAGGFVCAELMERYGRRGGIFIICAATPLILLAQSITYVAVRVSE
jgi:hypothetical protein